VLLAASGPLPHGTRGTFRTNFPHEPSHGRGRGALMMEISMPRRAALAALLLLGHAAALRAPGLPGVPRRLVGVLGACARTNKPCLTPCRVPAARAGVGGAHLRATAAPQRHAVAHQDRMRGAWQAARPRDAAALWGRRRGRGQLLPLRATAQAAADARPVLVTVCDTRNTPCCRASAPARRRRAVAPATSDVQVAAGRRKCCGPPRGRRAASKLCECKAHACIRVCRVQQRVHRVHRVQHVRTGSPSCLLLV